MGKKVDVRGKSMGMTKTYVSFGTGQTHYVEDKCFGYNCAAVIIHSDKEDGRALAFHYFGDNFCATYDEPEWEKRVKLFEEKG